MPRIVILIAIILFAQTAAMQVCECELRESLSHASVGLGTGLVACPYSAAAADSATGDDHEDHHCHCQHSDELFIEKLAYAESERPSMSCDDAGFLCESLHIPNIDHKVFHRPVDLLDRRYAARMLMELWLL